MSTRISATDITEEEALNAEFFNRADELIRLANEMCRPPQGHKVNPFERRGQVSAAMLFATARFNVWVSANTFPDGPAMQAGRAQVINYLMGQFQAMLEDQYDEYAEQFDNYMRFRKTEEFHANKDHHHDQHNH